MRKIWTIFKKQVRDTLRNKAILIQFIMFPIMTLIMVNSVKFDNLPENYFVIMFGTMYIGIIISTLLGGSIGIFCKNQMSATAFSVPLMMLLAFLPMISWFNKDVGKVSKFLYSQQIDNLLHSLKDNSFTVEGTIILVINAIIGLGIFLYGYRKKGLSF